MIKAVEQNIRYDHNDIHLLRLQLSYSQFLHVRVHVHNHVFALVFHNGNRNHFRIHSKKYLTADNL